MKFPDPTLVSEALINGKQYKFVNGSWRLNQFPAAQGNVIVNQTAPSYGPTPPVESSDFYLWEDSVTKQLHYRSNTVPATWVPLSPKSEFVTTTGELSIGLGRTFKLDNTTAGSKVVTFVDVPTGNKTALITLLVNGKVGAVTYPVGVVWTGGMAPEFTTGVTTLLFMWTGSAWIGSVGPQS